MKDFISYYFKLVITAIKNYDWRIKDKFCFLGLVFVVLVIDFLTKKIAIDLLTINNTVDFMPGFIQIELIFNKGAALGFGSSNPSLIIALQFIILFFVLIWFLFINNRTIYLGVSFIIGGALGNLINRFLTEQGVIDFLRWELFYPYSIFNLADFFIVVGIIICIINLIWSLFKPYMGKEKE